MNENELWQSFLETGAPEIYLLFNHARKQGNGNVPESTGTGTSYYRL